MRRIEKEDFKSDGAAPDLADDDQSYFRRRCSFSSLDTRNSVLPSATSFFSSSLGATMARY